jgi:hypothetical protein
MGVGSWMFDVRRFLHYIGECRVPGGPRGLQNRRRRASGEVGSIPILSAYFLVNPVAVSLCETRASPTGRRLHPQSKGGEWNVA